VPGTCRHREEVAALREGFSTGMALQCGLSASNLTIA
jgi:hypothetical protein